MAQASMTRRRAWARVAAVLLAAACHGAPAAEGPAVPGSVALAREMAPGINLGNALEALPTETSWGNPPATAALMRAYRKAGFRSVRIPVAWRAHADAQDRISPRWMARVRQVVDDARKAGLFVVVNAHWDGGWLDHPTYDRQAALNARLARYWTQIAEAFKDCDDHVLFAGSNEVRMDDNWGPPSAENADVQNGFNQVFVDAVRATGGADARRHLVVQSYLTNIDHALKHTRLPHDSVPERLFMEVHYYDPFDFTINRKSTVWQWGRRASEPAGRAGGADEDFVDRQFAAMQQAFVERGVAVIVGEYGAEPKRRYPGSREFVRDWARYVTASARRHALVPFWWDPGPLFDRKRALPRDPELIKAIVEAGL